MKLIFNDASIHDITPINNVISSFAVRMFKHLSNLDIPFRFRDSPYNITKENTYDQIVNSAKILGIDVQVELLDDQKYLNKLHKIYEKQYTGNDIIWLDFHESIHLCEKFKNSKKHSGNTVFIDFRESGGLLKQRFSEDYYTGSVLKVSKGDCYLSWAELAKTPYNYFEDNEPNDLDRILELCKPWIWLKPSIRIAVEDVDFNQDTTLMMKWFDQYKEDFIKKYGLVNWQPDHLFRVIPFGKMVDIDYFIDKLKSGNIPARISL